ncbi:MAG TPA: AI-2E family transporter [Candidatus Limnocylindrales bacterium]|nr:AI-2E family transporter [Candidatus Limnocylindrales bacterium]
MALDLDQRQRRWLNALLILGTLAVGLIFLGLAANVLLFFSDLLLIFFLAWLLAFMLSPVVGLIDRATPHLPRGIAVVATYGLLIGALTLVVVVVAQSLAASIGNFVASVPTLQARLPEIVAPWQERLHSLGLAVDLQATGRSVLAGLGSVGGDVLQPLSGLALASIGIFGNFLIIVILSLYMVADRDHILAFFIRLVPPGRVEEARLFQRSVATSFGGFLRGQAITGILYGLVAVAVHLVFGLAYGPASASAVGLLMAIPFFGPGVAWVPPVLVAVFTQPDATLPVLGVMIATNMVIVNVIQPRLMASAVGLHPLVVLASILVGLKVAGIAGAVFGIPIAAVLSSFFFYYLNRSGLNARDIASRAARRLEEREGRPVRVPQPPPIPPREPAAPGTVDASGRPQGEPPDAPAAEAGRP